MIVDFFWGLCLGLGAAIPWAVVPSVSTGAAMRASHRVGFLAGLSGAGPRLLLDGVFLFGWFLLFGVIIMDERKETALFCVSGAMLCVLGFRLITRSYTTRLWRLPSDPNSLSGPTSAWEDGLSIARSPSFLLWWIFAAPGLIWLLRRLDFPWAGIAGMSCGHLVIWTGWSLFLVNAARHHKGHRILDGRAHRSLVALGGLILSLLGVYFFYFDVVLNTLLPAYVQDVELVWF